jgi:short-subunit dehydrogenase
MRAIVITGGSSGLGGALALRYAAPGVTLGLVGRSTDRLEAVAEQCRRAGAIAQTLPADVGEAQPLADWLVDFDGRTPVDLLIAAAGTSGGPAPEAPSEGLALATRQVKTNLLGVINTLEPIIPAMTKRRSGRIGVVSSVAAYRGLPFSPIYSASKAAVRAYGEAMRCRLAPLGVGVSVICPGFFASAMTDRFKGGTPFLMSLDYAAERVKKGLDRGDRRVVFPWLLAAAIAGTDLFPAVIGDAIIRRFPFHIVPE